MSGIIYDDDGRDQMTEFVRREMRRLRNPDELRGRYVRTHRSAAAAGGFDICNSCECCETSTAIKDLSLFAYRNCCTEDPQVASAFLKRSATAGVWISDATTCSDGYATEWTVDATDDPVTATLRTTDGDIVYSLAAAQFNVNCGNKLSLTSSPAGCDAGPCICVGPDSCDPNTEVPRNGSCLLPTCPRDTFACCDPTTFEGQKVSLTSNDYWVVEPSTLIIGKLDPGGVNTSPVCPDEICAGWYETTPFWCQTGGTAATAVDGGRNVEFSWTHTASHVGLFGAARMVFSATVKFQIISGVFASFNYTHTGNEGACTSLPLTLDFTSFGIQGASGTLATTAPATLDLYNA